MLILPEGCSGVVVEESISSKVTQILRYCMDKSRLFISDLDQDGQDGQCLKFTGPFIKPLYGQTQILSYLRGCQFVWRCMQVICIDCK